VRRPIGDHLGDWHRAMVGKGRTAKHADLSRNRATRLAELAGAARLDGLQPVKIQTALASLVAGGLAWSRSIITAPAYGPSSAGLGRTGV